MIERDNVRHICTQENSARIFGFSTGFLEFSLVWGGVAEPGFSWFSLVQPGFSWFSLVSLPPPGCGAEFRNRGM